MKNILPAFVFIVIVFLVTSPVSAKSDEGCKLQGSWLGSGADGGRWIATYHGQSASSGTNDLDLFMDPTLGGLFPDAVKTSSWRGVWERTGGNTFKYTLIVLGLDGSGAVNWILKNSGDKTLTEDCNLMVVEGTLEVFSPDVDPFEGDPLLCIPGGGSWEVRMRVDPQCSVD
ncbi:MAG TPA: hypothetical protein VMY18_03475 [Acidobacteriota bacterium]|nr:hypothetical protein [Acidobacteriota bacterium]